MGNKKEVKYVQWETRPLEEFFKKLPKPTLRMRLSRFGKWIKNKIFPSSKRTIHGYRGYVESSHLPHHTSSSAVFRESQHFDPEEAYIQRMQEDAYLKSAGFRRNDLVLTEEEELKRKQEDAYFDSLPGYGKKDNERDDR